MSEWLLSLVQCPSHPRVIRKTQLDFFVWLDNGKASEKALKHKRTSIEDEIGDIFLNLLLFCNNANIDLSAAFISKLEKIAAKYPAELYKGKSVAQMFAVYDEKHWKSRLKRIKKMS